MFKTSSKSGYTKKQEEYTKKQEEWIRFYNEHYGMFHSYIKSYFDNHYMNLYHYNFHDTYEKLKTANDGYYSAAYNIYNNIDATHRKSRKLDRRYGSLDQVSKLAEVFKKYAETIGYGDFGLNLFRYKNYGLINTEIYNAVKMFSGMASELIIDDFTQAFKKEDYAKILAQKDLSFYELVNVLYSYMHMVHKKDNQALLKEFYIAKDLFYKMRKVLDGNVFAVELYLVNEISGEEAAYALLQTELKQDYLRGPNAIREMKVLASAMMCMKMSSCEKLVIEWLLKNADKDANLQGRYNALLKLKNNTNTVTVKKKDIDKNGFTFTLASLNWEEEDIRNAFSQYEVYNESIPYGFAFRQENHNIQLEKAKIPTMDKMADMLQEDLDEEFGEVNACAKYYAIVKEQPMEVIEVSFEEYPHMKLILYIFKIGKKLNIRMYTVYMPLKHGKGYKNDINFALSLQECTNPMISAWEDSVKECLVNSLQKVLNKAIITTNKKKDVGIVEF